MGLVKQETWEKWTPRIFPKIPGLGRAYRTFLFCLTEVEFFLIFTGKNIAAKTRKKVEADLVRHMNSVVPQQYHEILHPSYSVACKRRIHDAFWLDSLNDPKIDLTTQPITSLQAKGVTLGPGRTYPDPEDKASKAPTDERHLAADVIILANGFELTTWLSPLRVVGKGGVTMQEVWDERGGPQAYLGNAMDGFPNFFIIFGPNTATGHSSVILASENMVVRTFRVTPFHLRVNRGHAPCFGSRTVPYSPETVLLVGRKASSRQRNHLSTLSAYLVPWVSHPKRAKLTPKSAQEYTLKFIKRILRKEVKTFEVKKEKEIAWTNEMQEKLKGTVWHSGGCHSWYKTANDWNSIAYP